MGRTDRRRRARRAPGARGAGCRARSAGRADTRPKKHVNPPSPLLTREREREGTFRPSGLTLTNYVEELVEQNELNNGHGESEDRQN